MRFLARGIAREDVPTVDGDAREPVALGAGGDGESANLLLERHADGVAVVLADEDDRELVHAREVHRFVHLALVGGALAEIRDCYDVLAAHPGPHGNAHRVQDLGAHG